MTDYKPRIYEIPFFCKIQLLCLSVVLAWMISPPLAYAVIYRVICVFAVFLWIFFQIIDTNKVDEFVNEKLRKTLRMYVVCAVVYAMVLYFFSLTFQHLGLFISFYENITIYIFLFFGYVVGLYCVENRYEELKFLFFFATILVVIFSLTSIFRSSEYYLATRNAGGNDNKVYNEMSREAAMHGVAGFGFFAFSAVFAPSLLWLSFAYHKVKRAALFISFIIVEIGVFSAGYTIALMVSAIGIGVCIYFKIQSSVVKFFLIMLLVFAFVFWNDIGEILYHFLQSIMQGTMYENKVEDIFGFLIGGNSVGTFEARQERYLMSLSSILQYPIFGSYFLIGENKIGYHSSILDPYVSYGWLFGFFWTYIISIYPIKLISENKIRGFKFMMFITIFITALLNRTAFVMSIVFLIVPVISYIDNNTNTLIMEDN